MMKTVKRTCRDDHRKGPTTEHRTPVSRHERLMAACGRHVLWCIVLQTSVNRCTQLTLRMHEDSLVTSSRPPGQPQERPDDRTPKAAVAVWTGDGSSGRQVLPTSNVWGVDAAVRHVLWCLVLQTSVNSCTQLVLHPLGNMQLIMQ